MPPTTTVQGHEYFYFYKCRAPYLNLTTGVTGKIPVRYAYDMSSIRIYRKWVKCHISKNRFSYSRTHLVISHQRSCIKSPIVCIKSDYLTSPHLTSHDIKGYDANLFFMRCTEVNPCTRPTSGLFTRERGGHRT